MAETALGRFGFWAYIADKLPILLEGVKITFILYFAVVAIALPLATLVALAKLYGPKWLRPVLGVYTWVFRGTPLILQLSVVYYGFPNIGVVWNPWLVAIVVFSLCYASYESEVLRGGLGSIAKGQFEACHVLGMSFFKTITRVIIPQTIPRVLPTTCSEAITLFKDTSLVTSIALMDMMRTAQRMVIMDMRIDAFAVVLAIYLGAASLLVALFHWLERRGGENEPPRKRERLNEA
jgi:polar amino acid transport system permease protein